MFRLGSFSAILILLAAHIHGAKIIKKRDYFMPETVETYNAGYIPDIQPIPQHELPPLTNFDIRSNVPSPAAAHPQTSPTPFTQSGSSEEDISTENSSEEKDLISTAESSSEEKDLSTLAITSSFSCDGRPYGYYADPENQCNVYHVCTNITMPTGYMELHRASFRCGAGTVFSQLHRTCVRPENSLPISCELAPQFYSVNYDSGITQFQLDSAEIQSQVQLKTIPDSLRPIINRITAPFRPFLPFIPELKTAGGDLQQTTVQPQPLQGRSPSTTPTTSTTTTTTTTTEQPVLYKFMNPNLYEVPQPPQFEGY